MFGWFGGDKEAKFWSWFADNESRLYNELTNGGPKVDSAVNEVHARLAKVHRELACEFLLEEPRKSIFLSANGVRQTIPVVESLYSKAPNLQSWNVVKFKQRKPMETFSVRFGGRELVSESVRYRLNTEEDRIAVDLYFADFEEQYLPVYQQVGFIMLDSTLGEYDVMTKVGEINFLRLEAIQEGLPVITGLAQDFDEAYARLG